MDTTIETISLPWAANIDYKNELNQSYIKSIENLILSYADISTILKSNRETIAAFSMFLYRHNEAYHYNIPYLSWRYCEFLDFLDLAQQKLCKFNDFLDIFIQVAAHKLRSQKCEILALSMDQLWALYPDSSIYLVNEFDWKKAQRDNSVITMSFRHIHTKQVFSRCVELTDSSYDAIIEKCLILCNAK